MKDFLAPLTTKIEVSLVIGLVLAILYFSIDIYLYLTKKDFGRLSVYLLYFTRNDNGGSSQDAMNSRRVGTKVSIQEDIYKNRLLFWRMIFFGSRATLDLPVLNFGKHSDRALMPIRDWFVSNRCSTGELKRSNGFPFKEHKYFLTVVYDRSEENNRNRTLKALIIRADDLKNFDRYIERPPELGKNFELMKKVAEAFENKQGSFVSLMIVAA